MDLPTLKDKQTWLEVQSTALARKLRAGNDPVLVEEKRAIQEQLINLAQEIEVAQHERNTDRAELNQMEPGLDENATGAGGK